MTSIAASEDLLHEANVILRFLIRLSDYRDMWIQTVGQGGSSAAECLQERIRTCPTDEPESKLDGRLRLVYQVS